MLKELPDVLLQTSTVCRTRSFEQRVQTHRLYVEGGADTIAKETLGAQDLA